MTEQKQFSDWLNQKEAVLSDMRQVNHAEPKELIDLVQKLKVLILNAPTISNYLTEHLLNMSSLCV